MSKLHKKPCIPCLRVRDQIFQAVSIHCAFEKREEAGKKARSAVQAHCLTLTMRSTNILAHTLYTRSMMCQYFGGGEFMRVSSEAKRAFGGKSLPVE